MSHENLRKIVKGSLAMAVGHDKVSMIIHQPMSWGTEITLKASYDQWGCGGCQDSFFIHPDQDEANLAAARKCIQDLANQVRQYNSLPDLAGGDWWRD